MGIWDWFTGSGGDKETGSKTTGPWGPYQKPIRNMLGDLQSFMDKGGYPEPYRGQTYARPNNNMQQAWKMTERAANQGNPLLAGILGNAGQQINSGGMTPQMLAAMSPLQGIADGSQAIDGSNYQGILGNLTPMAQGKMIGQSNPYLMQNLGTAADEAATAVMGQFGGAGRYGSASANQTVGQNTGRIFSEGLGAQMNQDIQNQLAANNAMTGAAGGLANVQGTNIANRAGAANSMLGQYNAGQDRAMRYSALGPMMNDMRYADAAKLGMVGSEQQANTQAKYNDQLQRWNAKENQGMDAFSWYNSMLTGAPYRTETQLTPQASPMSGLLGGAMAGAGFGSNFGPWGTAIGGIGGGLFGLLGGG